MNNFPSLVLKNSGIEWIGNVPVTWKLYPAGRLFSEVKEKNRDNLPYTPLSFRYGAIVDKRISGSSDEDANEALSAYTIVRPGVIMLNGLNLNYDFITQRVALVKKEGIITSAYLAVTTNANYITPEFATYLLKSYDYKMVFHGIGSGIRKTLKYSDFKSLKIPVPSIAEQQAIAAYLDDQVTQIDSIIAESQASIEDYKQWKLSIIHEAVTKGINADVPKRTTDISWIGEMPCSWQLIKVKRIVRIENGSDPQSEGDIPVYGSGAESFRTCGEYKEGPTVLLGRKGATLHIPHYIEGKYWNVDTAFNVVVINNMVNLKYFYYTAICFDYPAYRSQTTLPSMTQTNYNNMKVPYPDIITQNAIASFLDNKVAEIDDVISEKESLIADLESYKRSLIYEAVTGKRKVV